MKFTAIKIQVIIIALLWVTTVIFKCSGKKNQQISDLNGGNKPNPVTVQNYHDEKEVIELFNLPEDICTVGAYSLCKLIANPSL